MPRNVCQFAAQQRNAVESLCVRCSAEDACEDNAALQSIGVLRVEERQIRVVTRCSGFVPYAGAFSRDLRTLEPLLQAAGIEDLCEACPGEKRRACVQRREAEARVLIARHQGRMLKLAVIGCTPVFRGNACQKLRQIAEPGECP